jgi:predicted Zn finger-like uncharacterized protein
MLDETYTRCPGCKTIFRVTPQQLAIRGGQVRCGHCKNVFDGNEAIISLAPQRVSDATADAEAALGPPTVTLRSAAALAPASIPIPIPVPESVEAPGADGAGAPPAAALTVPAITEAEAAPAGSASADALAWENRFAPRRGARLLGALDKASAIALPLLLVALIAQATFHFRDYLAAHVPAAKPALAKACAVLGCAISPLRDGDNGGALSIDASDLQADPAHRGLLVLTATLRNRSTWPLAYPHLELTLTDAQDQVVARRALAPADYAGGTVDVVSGIAPNTEAPIKLFIDASATTQAGYRLYAFYP